MTPLTMIVFCGTGFHQSFYWSMALMVAVVWDVAFFMSRRR